VLRRLTTKKEGYPMTELTDLTRFTSGSIAGRAERLPGPLRDLHRTVLRRFLQTGAPPTARWLRQAAADAGLDASAVDELSAADAVHLANGVVAVAYPFSGTRTPHRVELVGLPAVYAMCAIDALGLPAMTGRDGQITSADPHDATPIAVTARGGTWSWNPATAVVVAGRATDCGAQCGSFEAMCPHTVFHASPGSARAWLATHGNLDAAILGQDTAVECGRLNFGTLLTGPA
jgi:NAD-dependent dihydropyrimidine dehydrogenase PreA subunit